jgi:hypothetical protein
MSTPMKAIQAGILGLAEIYKAESKAESAKNHTPFCEDDEDEDEGEDDDEGEESPTVKILVPILKAEKQEITGEVLVPDQVDAHGDIMSAAVIEKAAGDFLASYNRSTTLGFMHRDFSKRFELRQSYVTTCDIAIASKTVKAGTWIMVVKILDEKIWKGVKDGKYTGFSIGGKAKTQALSKE